MPDGDKRLSIDVGHGISRRSVMRQIGAVAGLGAAAGLAGCQQGDGDGGDGNGNGNGNGNGGSAPDYQQVDLVPPPNDLAFDQDPPEREVTMVTHDASTSFFVPTIAGLHDATRQLGWSGNFTGPASGFDPEEQVNILESAVDSGPDVIATTVTDPSSYDSVIQRALDEDISVILYNTNAYTRADMRDKFGRALAYAGQDQTAAGYVCGLAMIDNVDADSGSITPGLSDPGHSALSARADGFEMAIENESDYDLNDRLNYTGDSNEGISAVENHISGTDDVVGIGGMDAFTWFIGNALENQNASGDITGGGFDLTEETLEHIGNDTLKYTIGQDPYSQGYLPVIQMFAYRDRGMPAKDYATGAEVIDSSNIDFATERGGAWDTLREWQNA